MTALTVQDVPVDDARSPGRALFDGLPARVYEGDPHWAPASAIVAEDCYTDAADGLLSMHPVVVTRDGRAIARAAGIIHPTGQSPTAPRQGWIGLVECVQGEFDAGLRALDDCRSWLREQGCDEVVAPRTSALMTGLLVAGFDRPQSILTPHNPPWYAELLAASGFRAAASSVALEFNRRHVPRFPAFGDPRVHVRQIQSGHASQDLERIRRFQQDIFAGSPGHINRTPEQMHRLADRIAAALDPELVIIAEDGSGATIGVLVCLSDSWQSRSPGSEPDRARLITIGVAPGWRGLGVALAMGRVLTRNLLRKGYQTLEASWVRSDNRRPQLLARALGARETKRFELLAWRDSGTRG